MKSWSVSIIEETMCCSSLWIYCGCAVGIWCGCGILGSAIRLNGGSFPEKFNHIRLLEGSLISCWQHKLALESESRSRGSVKRESKKRGLAKRVRAYWRLTVRWISHSFSHWADSTYFKWIPMSLRIVFLFASSPFLHFGIWSANFKWMLLLHIFFCAWIISRCQKEWSLQMLMTSLMESIRVLHSWLWLVHN